MVSKETIYVPRVTQLDAGELDKEVFQVLKSQVITVTKYYNLAVLAKWEPEIDAALQFILWKFSVDRVYSTFGQQLLSLKYSGPYSKNKAYMLALITIGSRYLTQRSRDITRSIGNQSFTDTVSMTLHWIGVCARVASLINLYAFLMHGKYPTVIERLLNLRPVSLTSGVRVPGYNFMMREALWHGFMELLGVTLPLVNFHYLRRKLVSLFPRSSNLKYQAPVFTVYTMCAVCNESPVLPQQIGCTHVFCYYCVHAHFLAEKEFQCPSCGISIKDSTLISPLELSIANKT